MSAEIDGQLTTEGKLLCGAILIAGLFEQGRVLVSDSADAEATRVLQQVLSAMQALKAEAATWPAAIQ
ncbi:hypothetical protein [Comamonas sp. B-9]|uniref:hypothetical protein n=1 Tax=Comamonas sp. B-9 TaxID=1055192 RepID=UPI0011DD6152|nr:hypothetical protein [Comamonas sp. B-9]